VHALLHAWVLENPFPLAICLIAVAAAVLWRGLVEGSRGKLGASAAIVAIAATVLATGHFVRTPGEHAREVVEELVSHAERVATEGTLAADDAVALFTPNAVMNYGRRENQGVPIDAIRRALQSLGRENLLESNRVTRLSLETLDADTGEVVFSCSTVVRRADSAIPTVWVARVRRMPADGAWKIDRLTFQSLYGKPPTGFMFR
jgi:hypothetical protein